MTTLESLEEIIRHHDARMNLLDSIAERQQTLLEEIKRGFVPNPTAMGESLP